MLFYDKHQNTNRFLIVTKFSDSELFCKFIRYKNRILLDCICFYVYIAKWDNKKEA